MKNTIRMLPIVLAIGLTACASKPAISPAADPVFVALEEVAQDIKSELVLISERQQIREPNRDGAKGTNEALNLEIEKFDFAGNIEDALTEVSELVGYKFTNNRVSAFPLTVLIREKDKPLLDIVRAIGAQAGSSVNVVVDERYREIRLEDN